tara:strand:+ start:6304 stop:7566 length:1263 start_codon:yes stop_codon:yes gene_type:complete
MGFGAKGTMTNTSIEDALGAKKSTEVEVAETPKEDNAQEQPKRDIPKIDTNIDLSTPKQEVKEEPKEDIKEENVNEDIKADTAKEDDKVTTLDNDAVLEYLRKQTGKDIKSFDDLLKEQEVRIEEKEVNPYDGILDDNDKAYLEFKKQTGRGYNEFLELNKNWDDVNDVDLARDRVRQETGLELNNAEADDYLASELGLVDLEDLEGSDKIKFKAYANKQRNAKKAEQKEYAVPKAKPSTEDKPKEPQREVVTLDNGQKMYKEDYEKAVVEREAYLNDLKASVDSVTEAKFKFTIDDNGDKKDLDFSYQFNDDDKHSMLSIAKDVNNYISNRFRTKEGKLDYERFAKALYFSEEANLQKVFNAMANNVHSETIEDYISTANNYNFNKKPLQKTTASKEGYGDLLGGSKRNGYGVRGNINT